MKHDIRETSFTPDLVNFGPLDELIGSLFCGEYMWMCEHKCYNGITIQAYKHMTTRNYIYLDNERNFYRCVRSNHNHDQDALELIERGEGIDAIIANLSAYREQDKMLEKVFA